MKWNWLICSVALLVAGCHRSERFLGKFSQGPVLAVAAAKQSDLREHLVLHGTMTAKCPVAGCWFMLRDASGIIKVDTKNAGFVVVDVPIKSAVLVSGRFVTSGSERLFEATGIRY